MKTSLLLLSLLSIVPDGMAAQNITIAAAADLNYAMKDLSARFEQKTGDKVTFSFGASGNFYSQIVNGAPFDLFFSADVDYPKKLAAAGLMEPNSLRSYALGRLVLWVPNGLKLDPQSLKMDLLLRPQVQKIAIANPEHAPYGRAAMAALQHFGLKDKVADKLVLGENVSQAAQFVSLRQCPGSADWRITGAVSGNEKFGQVLASCLTAPIRQSSKLPAS